MIHMGVMACQFPVIIFAGLGFLDGLADFLQAVAGTDTPGPWTVLLGQSKIFLILILSYVVLSTRYGVIQAVGGALAVVGTPVASRAWCVGVCQADTICSLAGSCLAILPHISSCSSAHHCAWYACADVGGPLERAPLTCGVLCVVCCCAGGASGTRL